MNYHSITLDPRIYDIQAAFKPGATIKELSQGYDYATNFNFADINAGIPIGYVKAKGKVVSKDIPKTSPRDKLYCVNGFLFIGQAPAFAEWAVEGSPRLLQGGKNVVSQSIDRDQLGADIWQRASQRTAVGITTNSKVIIVRTVDAITLDQLAELMAQLGCVDALAGDGGGSSYLYPYDNGWGRKLGSAIVAKKKEGVNVQKPIVIIDAGHGGKDPGGGSNQYWKEKDLTLQISLYQQKRFTELGVPFVMTRTTDVTLDPTPRTDIVKASGAKYCLCNHINAGGGHGWEIIHSIYDDGKLANDIKAEFDKLPEKESRIFTRTYPGDSSKDYYYMNRDTGAVSTQIIEYGFADNPEDTVYLKDHWQDMAEAVVKAFCGFIGHAYAVPAPVIPPVAPPQKKTNFTDVEAGRWSESAIKTITDAGIMNGYPDGTFKPTGNVTREELAAVVEKLLNQK